MGGRRRGEMAADLVRARGRFEDWRRSRVIGARIPGRLWKLAVKLAGTHGVCRTAAALRLDYYSLKRRLEGCEDRGSTATAAATQTATFVEVPTPSLGSSKECVIEFSNGVGASMRVYLKGDELPDLAALARSFWSGE